MHYLLIVFREFLQFRLCKLRKSGKHRHLDVFLRLPTTLHSQCGGWVYFLRCKINGDVDADANYDKPDNISVDDDDDCGNNDGDGIECYDSEMYVR